MIENSDFFCYRDGREGGVGIRRWVMGASPRPLEEEGGGNEQAT
jgi:hypothetical protein